MRNKKQKRTRQFDEGNVKPIRFEVVNKKMIRNALHLLMRRYALGQTSILLLLLLSSIFIDKIDKACPVRQIIGRALSGIRDER